ncbi:MAG: lipoprotein signal peptidase [Bacteroidales bacterium]|nr:lipoprotein signal peptidase [Bacteroidales bacterium]
MSKTKAAWLSGSLIVFLLIIDQIIKYLVKTRFCLYEDLAVCGDWFHLRFIENEGMAFGISFGEQIGKLLLTLFRIGVVAFIIVYLTKMIKKGKTDAISIITLSLIIAGAIGNIIDCLFYGLIFSESTPSMVASFFPAAGGYAPFCFGRVVDMFYFPLFQMPDWIPGFGGDYFFPAIFNFADACVTVGVAFVIIFSKQIFGESALKK